MNMGRTFAFELVVLLATVTVCRSYKGSVKPGACPPERCFGNPGRMIPYQQCSSDSGCKNNMKCCPDNGYWLCKPPAKEKPGKCPPSPKTTGSCNDLCTSDSECAPGLKCCPGENGKSCSPCDKFPEKPGACRQTGTIKCLMAERDVCSKDCGCPNTYKCCRRGCHMECQKPVSVIVKPGVCPPERAFTPSPGMTAFDRCTRDSECLDDKKCCLDNGYMVCKPPAKERPGYCPPPPKTTGTREDFCTSDNECAPGLKCCMGAKGLACSPCDKFPEKPGACKQTETIYCYLPERGFCSADCGCPNTEKCCHMGCSSECQKPVRLFD